MKLTDTILVKAEPDRPDDIPPENQHDASEYVRKHVPEIPIPEPLGILKVGRMLYSFTAYVPGNAGDGIWGELSSSQKGMLKNELEYWFTKIRNLKNDTEMFGFHGVCVDNRHHSIVSTPGVPITTYSQFLDFLLQNPHPNLSSEWFEYLKAKIFPEDILPEELVFTHGDLYPRNLILSEDGTLAGIIDWETAGWYPKNWEGIKAMMGALYLTKSSDLVDREWWRYIPECVEAHRDVLVDRVIDQTTGR